MHKLSSLIGALILVLALPGVAMAQSNSGLDQYQENAPGAGGGGSGAAGGSDSGTASSGSAETAAGGGSAGTTAGSGSGATGSAAGLSEAEAVASGGKRRGELPASGLDETLALALTGVLLMLSGMMLRRRVASEQRPLRT